MKHTFFIGQVVIAVFLLLGTGSLYAACNSGSDDSCITLVVDNMDSANDQEINLNLSRLMPIAEENTWTYGLMKGGFASSESVKAEVGSREKIGGGCLALNPVVFGADLTLYLANYGDHLSLHGVYLSHWKGIDELVLKFETRRRVEWRDFENRYISDDATPINENSCQNTGRGLSERAGLVLLEDLREQLGESGKKRGEINCKNKNSDLRSARSIGPVQTGTGTATLGGVARTLDWSLDALTLTPDYLSTGDVRVEMVFNPDIDSNGVDYSMFIDMTLRPGVGIVSLVITDAIDYVVDEVYELAYTFVEANLVSAENQITPKGSCPEDSGSFSFLMLMMLTGVFPLRSAGLSLKNS